MFFLNWWVTDLLKCLVIDSICSSSFKSIATSYASVFILFSEDLPFYMF